MVDASVLVLQDHLEMLRASRSAEVPVLVAVFQTLGGRRWNVCKIVTRRGLVDDIGCFVPGSSLKIRSGSIRSVSEMLVGC